MVSPNNYKIIIISGKNPLLTKSGYAVYSYSLAKTLKSLGYETKTYCCGRENSLRESPIGQIETVFCWPLKFSIFRNREMLALPFLCFNLGKVISKELNSRETLIWGIGPWSFAGVIANLLTRHPTILIADYFTTIEHEIEASQQGISVTDYGFLLKISIEILGRMLKVFFKPLEKLILKRAKIIVTHYHSTEKILSSQFVRIANQFTRLPYNIFFREGERQSYKFIDLPKDLPIIVHLSRQDPRKGINYLLHGLSILQNKGIKFRTIMAGAGWLLPFHQKLAIKLGLKNVHFPGEVENSHNLFRIADVFVFPSLEEGSSSLAIIEAMQQGLPIIASNIDGLPEDLKHNKEALLVKPRDPIAIAQAIETLLRDKILAKRLGMAAKTRYKQKFNEQQTRQALQNFLTQQVFPKSK